MGCSLAAGVLVWLSAVPARAAMTFTYAGGLTSEPNQWLSAANWTGLTGKFAGRTVNTSSTADGSSDVTTLDTAVISAFGFNSSNGLAINFAPSPNAGVSDSTGAAAPGGALGVLGIGEINYATTTALKGDLAIGNSSATPGILRLNGNDNDRTIAAVTGNYNLSLVNAVGNGSSTMDVMLGNSTSAAPSTINVADLRTMTIGSRLIERTAGSPLNFNGNHTGRLLLNGSNTYTGQTEISGGTLVVQQNGIVKGKVLIDPKFGATNGTPTLAGNGTVQDAVTVNGIITAGSGRGDLGTPRDSVGLLTTNTETWAAGGAYVWKLNDSSAGSFTGGGTAWDKLVMNSLNLTSTSTSPFTIRLINNAGSPLSLTAGKQFQVAHLNSSFSVPSDVASRLVLDVSGLNSGAVPFSYSFVNNGSSTDLIVTSLANYNAAPEPTTALLACAGATSVLTRRHRKSVGFTALAGFYRAFGCRVRPNCGAGAAVIE